MNYSIKNIRELSLTDNPVKISYITDSSRRSKWKTFKLEEDISATLSNNRTILIPKGFEWDLSSVPRVFSWILRPYGNFLIGALIHDYLYRGSDYIIGKWFNGDSEAARLFADDEMLIWSEAMQGTKKISWFNIDNNIRYRMVRIFGRKVWES